MLPAIAVTVPVGQVVAIAGVAATVMPLGNMSVNDQPTFEASSVVLVMVNVSVDVPPEAILVGANDLSSCGVES